MVNHFRKLSAIPVCQGTHTHARTHTPRNATSLSRRLKLPKCTVPHHMLVAPMHMSFRQCQSRFAELASTNGQQGRLRPLRWNCQLPSIIQHHVQLRPTPRSVSRASAIANVDSDRAVMDEGMMWRQRWYCVSARTAF